MSLPLRLLALSGILSGAFGVESGSGSSAQRPPELVGVSVQTSGTPLPVNVSSPIAAPAGPSLPPFASASATPQRPPSGGPTEPPPSPLAPGPASLPPTGLTASPEASDRASMPTAAPALRAHLHRPGTDVDGDVFSGNLSSAAYIIKGNVVLHSNPQVDREIGAASESDDPLTVTADEVDVDKMGMSFVAKGHVHFIQGARSGNADVAMLDEAAHTLDLIGNADVLQGDRRAAAAKMHYDMRNKDFLGSGNVRIYEPLPTPNPTTSSTPPAKRKRRLPL